jgi:hypothetical protein
LEASPCRARARPELVDKDLTKEMIETGAELVRKLDESGIRPDAVFWFYFPDKQAWKLVIAKVKVGEEGPKEIYRRIQKILAKFPKEISGLSLDDVALAKPTNALPPVPVMLP